MFTEDGTGESDGIRKSQLDSAVTILEDKNTEQEDVINFPYESASFGSDVGKTNGITINVTDLRKAIRPAFIEMTPEDSIYYMFPLIDKNSERIRIKFTKTTSNTGIGTETDIVSFYFYVADGYDLESKKWVTAQIDGIGYLSILPFSIPTDNWDNMRAYNGFQLTNDIFKDTSRIIDAEAEYLYSSIFWGSQIFL